MTYTEAQERMLTGVMFRNDPIRLSAELINQRNHWRCFRRCKSSRAVRDAVALDFVLKENQVDAFMDRNRRSVVDWYGHLLERGPQ